MKKLLVVFIFLCSSHIQSQEKKNVPLKNTQRGFLAIDFLSIDMPTSRLLPRNYFDSEDALKHAA